MPVNMGATRPAAGRADDVLEFVSDGADLIVPLANGEPVSVLDAIEANARRCQGVRMHQMHVLARPALLARLTARPSVARLVLPVAGDSPAFHETGL